MRLKIATTLSFLFGIGLLLAWPIIVGSRPEGEDREALAQFAARALAVFGLSAISFMISAFLASLLVRKARQQFGEERRANLRSLVEGSLRDHERRKGS